MPTQPLPDGSLRRLFDEALQRTGTERSAHIRQACGADEALRRELEDLLRAYEQAEAAIPEPASFERDGDRIGPYKLIELIGEGGFGKVWMAEQEAPLRRKVALKVLKPGMDTQQVVARFEAERQALAMMDHPHIARVFDAGVTASGRPYFVMELVRGMPITAYCDEARLSARERLELFVHVCKAVQHAHQKGIIHRDLKPGNVLVTLQDGRPVPKVIDFGIAKATAIPLTEKTLHTGFMQVLGTPEYMAPEQASMSAIDVDTRADVYSLGVLLYELLTGTRPFDLKELIPLGLQEFLRRVREVEPEKPSTRISTLGARSVEVCARRRVHPRSFSRLLHGDLDWILLKALEKERGRRYATAERFAADIGRHLRDEPVEAGPPSRVYRMRKHLRRHWVGATASATIVLALCVGAALAWLGYAEALQQEALAVASATRADEARDAALVARADETEQRKLAEAGEAKARREALRAERVVGLLMSMVRGSNPLEAKDPDYTLRQLLEDLDHGLAQELAHEPAVEAALRELMAQSYVGLGLLEVARPQLDRALALNERAFGSDSTEFANCLGIRASWLAEQGRNAEARQVLEQQLALLEQHEGAASERLVTPLKTLAEVCIELAALAEAEGHAKRAVELAQHSTTDDGRALFDARRALALVLSARYELPEAEQLQRANLEAGRRVMSESSWRFADGQCLLAHILSGQSKLAEADELSARVCASMRAAFGEGHPIFAYSLIQRARMLVKLGRSQDGEDLLRQALDDVLGQVKEQHQVSGAIRRELAAVLNTRGRHEEAGSLLEDEIAILRGKSELNGLELAKCLNSLGIAYGGQRRWQEAEAVAREAIQLQRQLGAEENAERQLGPLLMNLALRLQMQERLHDAETVAVEAVELSQNRPDDQRDHEQLAPALFRLAEIQQAQGHSDEAAERFRQAAQLQRELLADVRHKTGCERMAARRAAALGLTLLNLEQWDEAGVVMAESVDLERRFGAADGPLNLILALNRLGFALFQQERYVEATAASREWVELEAATPGRTEADHALSLANLAENLAGLGNRDEAIARMTEAIDIYREFAGQAALDARRFESDLVRYLVEDDRGDRAVEVARARLDRLRARLPRGDAAIAHACSLLARALLSGEPASAEAEELLRECLQNEAARGSTSWKQKEASTLLGACLMAQGRMADSEPRLREGAEATSTASAWIEQRRPQREAALLMAQWYEAAGRPKEAATWHGRLASLMRTSQR